ncbi:Tetraspanin/Peripherin [Catenaria anguillulae PL171]|uniref:Tetraspanin/Peripherin n=1 Tax=Catenaria anguillulae PL171 TaxID=765915 RepID=A0A1Y2I2C2_9FUNG|nr:Tetraspanin/Peripherin [Catenaria anguillulae PL171]
MANPMTQWFSRLNRIRGTIWILKNLVMLVNVLALIASVGFFIAGIVGYNESNIVGIVSSSLPAACIGLGVIVALVSLVGCFGAANESPFFMRVYFGLLAAIVVSEIVIGGVAYSHKDNVEIYLSKFWTNAFNTDKSVVARIQRLLQCCGFRTVTEMAVLDACPVQTACYTRMRERFMSGLHTMGSIALALGVIEVRS